MSGPDIAAQPVSPGCSPAGPLADLEQAIRDVRPDLTVLAAVTAERYEPHTAEFSRLAAVVPLGLAGAGATQALTAATGTHLLPGDPVTEAHRAPEWRT
jgi:hypothetical protein